LSRVSRAVLAPIAERDLLKIVRWIAQDNPKAAIAFRDALNDIATSIGNHPEIGVVKSCLASPSTRFLTIKGFPYVVVYTTDKTPPLIVRVIHGARDFPEVLRDL